MILSNKIEKIAGAKYFKLVFYYIFIVCCEVVLRLNGDSKFFGIGLMYILAFSLPLALIYHLLSSVFPKTLNKIVAVFLVVFTFFIYVSEIIYFDMFRIYYPIFSFLNGGMVLNFADMIIAKILSNIVNIIVLLILVVVFFFSLKYIRMKRISVKRWVLNIATTLVTYALCVLLLFVGGKAQFSPYDLYFKTNVINFSVDKLGLNTTLLVDVGRLFFGYNEEYNNTIDSGSENPGVGMPQEEPIEYEANIMDIDFAFLIENELDPVVLSLHEYFNTQPPTFKNEKTGMFEGYNLITIVAESFSHILIDPELTPTLYKLYTEGFQFADFYTPLWTVSTLDGEYVANQGLIPKSNVWSMWQSSDNLLPFTLGNQFRNIGYNTYAYHNHTYDYYHRDNSHPNMGYDYKGVGSGLEMENVWPRSDYDLIDITTDEYLSSGEPFHVYYLTVSGHQLYTFAGNTQAYRNRDAVRNLSYPDSIKAYIACNLELEKALTLLLERLKESGQLENTVIAISADHYPYALSNEELSELAGHDIEANFEIYRNGFILYNAGMKSEVITQPCSSLDIVPTLSNLFGIEYDSRLLMGRDIFSVSEPLVIFFDRSFITRYGTYNTKTEEFTHTNKNATLPEGYKESISAIVNNKFSVSERILDYDYYRILFGQE